MGGQLTPSRPTTAGVMVLLDGNLCFFVDDFAVQQFMLSFTVNDSQYPFSQGLPGSMNTVWLQTCVQPVAHDLRSYLGAVVGSDVPGHAA